MRLYFRHRIYIDILLSVFVTISVLIFPNMPVLIRTIKSSSLEAFSLTVLNTSASLLGFVLAASTFLIAHIQHPRFSIVRKAASYKQLPKLVGSSLWRLLALTVASGLLVFISPTIEHYAIAVFAGMIMWALTAIWATLWIVIRIDSIPLE